jgi:Na+-driven multidrug efflux pump
MGLGAVGVWLGFALGTALAGLALTLRFLSQTRGEAGAVRLGLQPV